MNLHVLSGKHCSANLLLVKGAFSRRCFSKLVEQQFLATTTCKDMYEVIATDTPNQAVITDTTVRLSTILARTAGCCQGTLSPPI